MTRLLGFCSALTILCTAPATAATTVSVENRSPEALTLDVEQWPEGQQVGLAAVMAPQETSFAVKPGAKVLTTGDTVSRYLIDVTYTDDRGHGCRFRTVPVAHTPAMRRVVPKAEAIGARSCEATTGATVGDFIFVAR